MVVSYYLTEIQIKSKKIKGFGVFIKRIRHIYIKKTLLKIQ